MKKLIVLVLGASLLLCLVSCNPEALNDDDSIESIDKKKIQHPDDR